MTKKQCAFKFKKDSLEKLRKKSFGERHVKMQERAAKIQRCKIKK